MEGNFSIRQIMQRYDISASFNDTVKNGQTQAFIQALLRVFEGEVKFRPEDFSGFSIEVISDYIKCTHKFYLQKKLLEIEQSIHLLLQDYDNKHPLLVELYAFYADYKTKLSEHIGEEETDLLPYIDYLQNCEKNGVDALTFFTKTKNYSLQYFITHHNDTECDLCQVRNTIMRYSPPDTNATPYRILLGQLEAFEKDLAIHGMIEDKVLIPKALVLEEELNVQFLEKALLN